MRRKVLAVASIGGHWIQLLRIARPMEEHYEIVYMCTHPKCAAIVEGKKFYLATDFSRSDAWKLIPAFFRQLNIIRKEKPDAIITTGAAPGLICVFAGWLLHRKTIWIDSIANVNHLSLSGRIAALFVSKIYTQWQQLATDKIHYAGDIFG